MVSTLITRPDDSKAARIVVVMQRVHEDDLVGYLLEQGGFEVLNLPARDDDQVDALVQGMAWKRLDFDFQQSGRVIWR
jgi:hypothetical protein